jgi:polyphosphate kinase 2 (PPK2 family)
LNVSRKEQKKRFLERLDDPNKRWKFSDADITERKYWDEYVHAYEEAICATAAKRAPWFVVPADNKWFTRLVVAAAIVEALESLGLEYPMVDSRKEKELVAVHAALLKE